MNQNSITIGDFTIPIEHSNNNKVKIDPEDIEEEVNFGKSAIICFVIIANPQIHVMEGFVRRIWGRMGVDVVAPVGKGTFMVRFKDMGGKDKVMSGGHVFFDSKFVIIKSWTPDMNVLKDEIRTVPTWV